MSDHEISKTNFEDKIIVFKSVSTGLEMQASQCTQIKFEFLVTSVMISIRKYHQKQCVTKCKSYHVNNMQISRDRQILFLDFKQIAISLIE